MTRTIAPAALGSASASPSVSMSSREVKSAKKEDANPYTRAPKIQRLVTPLRLQRRRIDHQKEEKAEFDALIAKRVAEKKAKVAAIKAAHHKTAQAVLVFPCVGPWTREHIWRCVLHT
ncbi:hypothetical protein H0H92_004533 [Tricholoma furcatifolium]|nr:hypothetical protein H0H92_004533 [Tricholoma furcatifolium]